MPLTRSITFIGVLDLAVPGQVLDLPVRSGRALRVEVVPRHGATWASTLTLKYVTAAGVALDFTAPKTLTAAAPRVSLSETELSLVMKLELRQPDAEVGKADVFVSEEEEEG